MTIPSGPATAVTGHSRAEGGPPSVLTTKILAIGRVTGTGAGSRRSTLMPDEIRATVRLHLAGFIDQWFTQTASPGVVFILNLDKIDEAKAMLRDLPLGKAGMMEFELLPLGPLSPLAFLL